MKKLSGILKISVALVLLINSSLLTQAQIVATTLLGGDPSDGITLNSSQALGAIYADSLNTGLTYSLQGVAFEPYQNSNFGSAVSGISIVYDASYPTIALPINIADTAANQSFTAPGNSANDTALLSIVNGGLIYDGDIAGFTVTFSGLTAGDNYKLNFISSLTQYGARSGTLSINGSAPQTFNYDSLPTYLLSDTATAQPNGTITAFFSDNGQNAPFTNAIEIESMVVPEPSSYALLILSGAMTLVFLRARSKTT
jgi:hypothetical protein